MGTNHSVKDYDMDLRSMWSYWGFGFLLLIISTLIPYLYYLTLINISSNNNNNNNNNNNVSKSYEEFTPDLTILLPVKNESILIEEKLLEIISFNYSDAFCAYVGFSAIHELNSSAVSITTSIFIFE